MEYHLFKCYWYPIIKKSYKVTVVKQMVKFLLNLVKIKTIDKDVTGTRSVIDAAS